jgi:single-strand DNA-binding protein
VETIFMNLNKAMIIGNITRDPEVRTTPQGTSVCNFSVATNLIWTDASGQRQEKAEFHNIVAWRKLAEICGQYLRKGSKVYIEGRLQTREWEGQDGIKRYRTEIIAENMIMLDRAGAGTAKSEGAAPTPTEEIPENEGESEEVQVENIPF